MSSTGSTLWVLRMKTEDFGTLVKSTAGASTEILGAFCYSVRTTTNSTLSDPLFDVENSDFSASYITNLPPDYPNKVSEMEDSQTGVLYDFGSS